MPIFLILNGNWFLKKKIKCTTAAGYDVCIVETIGVGQSETIVSEMVDM